MSKTKDTLIVESLAGYPQPISAALWRMQDSRERTLKAVKDVAPSELEWQATGLQNHIGTLLYHIAMIETDWLFDEVLQQDWTPQAKALFPYPVRNENGHLTPIANVSLNDHLARLATTRQYVLDEFKAMTIEDFTRLRELSSYDVSPEWVLHHLAQHEDEHRGEITTIRTLYRVSHTSE